MSGPSIAITAVDSATDRSVLRPLLSAFHEWLLAHEDSHDPETALARDVLSLERASESRAWIARWGETPAGCVLLYGASDDLAELKRLWVEPAYRGEGIGRALTWRAVEAARERGYERVGLTTPPWSETAHAIYESMGFERTPPHSETRLPERYHDDAIFMQLDLLDTAEDVTDV